MHRENSGDSLRFVQQQNKTVNAATFIIRGSKIHNFLENCKILAEK